MTKQTTPSWPAIVQSDPTKEEIEKVRHSLWIRHETSDDSPSWAGPVRDMTKQEAEQFRSQLRAFEVSDEMQEDLETMRDLLDDDELNNDSD